MRVPMLPVSYIEKEMKIQGDLTKLIKDKEMTHDTN